MDDENGNAIESGSGRGGGESGGFAGEWRRSLEGASTLIVPEDLKKKFLKDVLLVKL